MSEATKPDKTRQLSQEQMNAIEHLLQGRSDRAVSEAVGVSRQTVWEWRNHDPLFIAELNRQRYEMWKEAHERLKSLAHEAVNVLTRGLSSQDENVAITAAVHILKTVGLYGEVKQNFGPDTPEEAVWKQAVERKLHGYTALRPDSFSDLSEKNHM